MFAKYLVQHNHDQTKYVWVCLLNCITSSGKLYFSVYQYSMMTVSIRIDWFLYWYFIDSDLIVPGLVDCKSRSYELLNCFLKPSPHCELKTKDDSFKLIVLPVSRQTYITKVSPDTVLGLNNNVFAFRPKLKLSLFALYRPTRKYPADSKDFIGKKYFFFFLFVTTVHRITFYSISTETIADKS